MSTLSPREAKIFERLGMMTGAGRPYKMEDAEEKEENEESGDMGVERGRGEGKAGWENQKRTAK